MSFRHSPPTVALVGLGQQGMKQFHSLFQLQMEGVLTIAALVDIVQRDYTLKYPFFADIEEMLQAVEPDIVMICTPNFLHYQQTMAALAAGADVIKEKPLALSMTEGQQLVATARKQARLIVTCQQRLYSFLWQTAKEQLSLLGPLKSFSYSLTLEDQEYSWYCDRDQGGGAWTNLGWHGLQMVEWLLGDIEQLELQQKQGRLPLRSVTSDYLALAKIRLKNQVIGRLFVCSGYPAQEVFRVWAEKGSLVLNGRYLIVYQDGHHSQVWQSPESKQDWLTAQLRSALDTLDNKRDSMDLELSVLRHLEPTALRRRQKGAYASS